ncbi:hypothetical protein H7170_01960 [Candidatus Gracilibacteria bacterium]|nr:hypothetical protein [Candidatus Gracilibacteria bacterium]
MLTRATLSQHSTVPQLPPFSIDTSARGVRLVTLDTFWQQLATSQSGFIGNSISGKVQVLIP